MKNEIARAAFAGAGALAAALALFAAPFAPANAATDGQKFGAWTMHCKQANGKCAIVQDYRPDGGRQGVRVVVGALGPKGEMIAFVTAPLGVALRPGLGFRVDKNKGVLLPYEICTPAGCSVGVALTDPLIANMKRGSQAFVMFRDTTGKAFEAPISLNGFTNGFGALPR